MDYKKISLKNVRLPGIVLLLLIPGTLFFGWFVTSMEAGESYQNIGAALPAALFFLVVVSILLVSGIRRIRDAGDNFLPLLTKISIGVGVLSTLFLLVALPALS